MSTYNVVVKRTTTGLNHAVRVNARNRNEAFHRAVLQLVDQNGFDPLFLRRVFVKRIRRCPLCEAGERHLSCGWD